MIAAEAETGAPGWRRTLWLMVAMQAIMAGSFTASGPFMPLFLVQLGVHPLDRVEIWSGLMNSVNFLFSALASPFWGILADRIGRKPMVIRCAVSAATFYALIAFSANEWQALAFQATSGVFGGFAAAAMTMVATQAPERRLGFALGWMSTGQLVGSLIGPLVGGLIADHTHDYRLVFVATAAGGTAAAVGVTAFVHERFERTVATQAPAAPWVLIGEIARHRTILPLLFVLMLAQMTAQAASPVIPLFVQALVGESPWLATAAGASVAVTGVAGLLVAPWLGRQGDRIGQRVILLFALAGGALFTLPQAFATNIWEFVALRFGVGLFLGGVLPSANALVGRAVARGDRGRVYGVTASATFLGQFTGPLAGGLIAAHFGVAAVFLAIGGIMLLNLATVAFGTRPSPPP